MRSTAAPSALGMLPALLFSFLPAVAAGAAESPDASAAPFIERFDLNIINVEAFVTGKDGKSVKDLQMEDFEVFEDGQRVELTNFFQNDRPGTLAAETEAAAATTASQVPEDQRLNLVVYVDLYNMRPPNRKKIMKQLGGFLEDRIGRGDRIMSIVHQRNLQLIHPFTQDVAKVNAGIAQMSKWPPTARPWTPSGEGRTTPSSTAPTSRIWTSSTR